MPAEELRLITDRSAAAKPPSSHSQPAPSQDAAPPRTPRVVVHSEGQAASDSSVFVVEGSQDALAMGGGMRGIRFLRNSTRA